MMRNYATLRALDEALPTTPLVHDEDSHRVQTAYLRSIQETGAELFLMEVDSEPLTRKERLLLRQLKKRPRAAPRDPDFEAPPINPYGIIPNCKELTDEIERRTARHKPSPSHVNYNPDGHFEAPKSASRSGPDYKGNAGVTGTGVEIADDHSAGYELTLEIARKCKENCDSWVSPFPFRDEGYGGFFTYNRWAYDLT